MGLEPKLVLKLSNCFVSLQSIEMKQTHVMVSMFFLYKLMQKLSDTFSGCFETDLSYTPETNRNMFYWFREPNQKINRNRLSFVLFLFLQKN
jgi:hypothetical protein